MMTADYEVVVYTVAVRKGWGAGTVDAFDQHVADGEALTCIGSEVREPTPEELEAIRANCERLREEEDQ